MDTKDPVIDKDVILADVQDPVARFLDDVLNLDWLKLWFIALVIYGPVEKLIIPYIDGYLNLSTSIVEWTPHVESLLTGFVEFPFFLAFYLWSGRGIVNIFVSLEQNQSFSDQDRYIKFIQRVQRGFKRGWLTVLSVGLAGVAMALMHFVIWGPNAVVPVWFGDRLYARILSLILVGVVAYAVSQTVLREILAIIWLRRLWDEMGDELGIHPYSADGAGGLGALGQHGVFFFSFIMMVMLFIVMATIWPSLIEANFVAGDARLRFWNPLILVIWVGYFMLVPLMFFLLFWPPHKAVIKKRDEQLNKLSKQLDEQLVAVEASMTSEPDKVTDILEKVDNLKQIRTIFLDDFPTWPISTQMQRMFGLTSALPTAYSLLTVVVNLFL